jgi:hypothetical protein
MLLILQVCHLVILTSRVKGHHFQTFGSVQKALADAMRHGKFAGPRVFHQRVEGDSVDLGK